METAVLSVHSKMLKPAFLSLHIGYSQAAYVIYFNYFAKFEFLLLCV